MTWCEANLLDPSFDFRSVFDSAVPDVLIHLAWRNGFNHSSSTHMSDLSAHYNLICNALDAGVSHVSAMGTMHEVGYWEGVITADTPCNPLSLYAVAKDSLRRALMLETGRREVIFQWLRGFYIYGDDETAQSIFGKLLRAARSGQKTFPFTSGRNLYDFTRVDLLAKMIVKASLQSDETGIINCCSGKPESLADRVEGFIADNNLDISLEYGAFPDRPYDSPGVWGDPRVINKILKLN